MEKKFKNKFNQKFEKNTSKIDINNNIGLYTIVDQKKANLVSEYLALVPKGKQQIWRKKEIIYRKIGTKKIEENKSIPILSLKLMSSKYWGFCENLDGNLCKKRIMEIKKE